jgi:hypothetical protein
VLHNQAALVGLHIVYVYVEVALVALVGADGQVAAVAAPVDVAVDDVGWSRSLPPTSAPARTFPVTGCATAYETPSPKNVICSGRPVAAFVRQACVTPVVLLRKITSSSGSQYPWWLPWIFKYCWMV